MVNNKSVIILVIIILASFSFAGELPRPNNFGGKFSLEATTGKVSSSTDWEGKVILLNFGFTSCPDVCPMVLSKLTLVQNQLDKDGKKLQVVFVSIDPDRDSLERIKIYLRSFHGSFIGMRGSEQEVANILKRYGASVKIDKANNMTEISHSDYVYIIDQKGYVAGFYDVKTDYKALLSAIKKIL